MNFKNKLLSSAIVLSLSAGSAVFSTAQAGAFAESIVEISNLTFTKNSTGILLDRSDFASDSFTSNANTLATLNGSSATDDSPTGPKFSSDLFSIKGAPTAGYSDNDFTAFSGSPTGNYSIGDQFENGSPVGGYFVDGVTGAIVTAGTLGAVPVTTGATLKNASYVGLENGGTGSADSNNGLAAKFQFTGFAGIIDIDFGISAYLETFLDIGDAIPSAADASFSVIFSLKEVGVFGAAELIKTNGTSDTGTFDPISGSFIQTSAASAVGSGFGAGLVGFGPGVPFVDNFHLSTELLDSNREYQLSARILTAADAAAVPEPSLLALMGLGLLSITAIRKRTVK